MDCSTRLQRQRSCACPPLDIVLRCGSLRSTAAGFARISGDEWDDDSAAPTRRSSWSTAGTRLRGLWRRITREKRKVFNPAPAAYDPFTYAQNFDEGWAAEEEPENLSRSFSARFAVPSGVLQRTRW
ncbi:unnamed protein product [Musa acuminata subsp. burmannicoides]